MLEFRRIIVRVSDMTLSTEFYRDLLGLPTRFESPNWTEFDTPETTFTLQSAPRTKPSSSDDGNSAGGCHPSFIVDDIDAYHERLTSKGVVCAQLPRLADDGHKRAQYVDPDGLLVTLTQASCEYVFREEFETEGPHGMLSTDGKGNWWRRIWRRQCQETILLLDQCQGVEGHDGDHWCFKKDGSFAWSRDKDHPEYHKAASGWTPPDHPEYRSPVEMQKHHHMEHFTDSEVTDAEEIARLERGEVRGGESINRPCTPEEVRHLGLDRRLHSLGGNSDE